MKGRSIVLGLLAAVPSAAFGVGCDAAYGGFLGAVPIAEVDPDAPVEVYLAIDGLSRAAFDRARAQGAFATSSDADLVTAFPGTSDYAWTRLLGTGSLPGYEIQYFDPGQNRIVGGGLRGVVEHPVREGLADSFACYRRFDFLGNGYFWMAAGYQDAEAALPGTLDELFSLLLRRSRQQKVFLGYLLNVDVLGHKGGLGAATAALVEIDRRIQAFQREHPDRFRFTLFGDHGNAHRQARLVDPADILRESGVAPVGSLASEPVVEAVPIVHVRVTYVALHTHPASAALVAERVSRHKDVDLAVARLPLPEGSAERDSLGPAAVRIGIWRGGRVSFFSRLPDGSFLLEDPQSWRALGVRIPPEQILAGGKLRIGSDQALAWTHDGPYPDLLYRAATAFTHPAATFVPEVLISLPDDVASFGFHIPGSGDGVAIDGFHGGLARGGSLSVLATEGRSLPPAVRSDDLLDLFPALAPPARQDLRGGGGF